MKEIFYTKEELNRIREQISIVSFLEARGASLKRSGSSYKTNCIFHEDPDPSLIVYPGSSQFHCFGCEKHGDVITLLMQLDGVSFLEACRRLGGNPLVESPTSDFNKHRREKQLKATEEDQLRSNAREAREHILKKFAWSIEDIRKESPTLLNEEIAPVEAQLMLVTLFYPDEVIWVGEVYDSNRPGSENHFRPAFEFSGGGSLPGSRTTPSIFSAGETRRRASTVAARPYIVIEADEAIGKKPESDFEKTQNRLANAALIRWCQEGLGMDLAAIVDTGNKSLHGWFRKPENPRVCYELETIACDLGIDNLFNQPAQPVRLPGFIHEKSGRCSRLLWLKNCSS